jgi:hypothetical protein
MQKTKVLRSLVAEKVFRIFGKLQRTGENYTVSIFTIPNSPVDTKTKKMCKR